MKLNRLLKMSLSSVYNNKIRSFLTMLGIIIGISSVIVLVGMGEGTKAASSFTNTAAWYQPHNSKFNRRQKYIII